MEKKLYYGIDLGTTNSAISYGYLDSDNKVKTQICKINRLGKEGGMESKETLPSVVYYKVDNKSKEIREIVGDFAKNQYGKKYGSVVKSVKNYIGNTTPLALADKIEDKLPEDVSASVLKHLVTGIKDKLSLEEIPKNVVITIPASFDSDQCNATLKAGELAGLNVKDEDGKYKRDMLLYEPKAVIYNISNMVSLGEIPKSVIDFSTKKNILVFDLGGGTLDVALYEVYNNEKIDIPIINELSVGRYTRIGGDDFDKILAEDLVKRFLDYTGFNSQEVNYPELTQIMESRAEYLKLELSDKVFNSKFSGKEISENEEFEISEMDIYKGAEFETYITKKEIENILAPLMGNHLKKDDVNNIDRLVSEKDVSNIIYPILDVLAKARENGYSSNVDAVILNGGMTKFYLIKDRIEKFFELTAITVNDPDLAVAKGAAFYQYCLDKLDVSNAIDEKNNNIVKAPKKSTLLQLGRMVVNEDINLGLEKGYIRKLIKAGTSLPTGNIQLDEFILPTGTNRIEIPIYLGRGKDTNFPNRRIANRIINLQKSYPAKTVVTLMASVDENKVLNLSGYIGKNKNEKIEISIDTGNSTKEKEKSSKISSTNYETLNPLVEFETLKVNCEILENIKRLQKGRGSMHPLTKQKMENAKCKISTALSLIKTCRNKEDFEKIIVEKISLLDNTKILKGLLIDIGINIFPIMSKQGQERFLKDCRGIVNLINMRNNHNKDVITKAIIALGELKDFSVISDFENMLEEFEAKNYNVNIVRALGKISSDNDYLEENFMEIPINSVDIDPYIYAIGKTFSRKVSGRTDEKVERVVKKLLEILKAEKQNKDMALLALGEICDSTEEIKFKLEEMFVEKIGKELSLYIRNCTDDNHKEKATLILNVIFGLKLTEEEKIKWESLCSK